MKVLVNGGLNLSELDGWWAEAYSPEVGWAIGDGAEHGDDPAWDAAEAEALYTVLEREVIPEFYARDARGIPVQWVARIRESMARLTPMYAANRVVAEYTERHYLPGATAYRQRAAEDGRLAAELFAWQRQIASRWQQVRFGGVTVETGGGQHQFTVHVELGDLPADAVRVELYADPRDGQPPVRVAMTRSADAYTGQVAASRPAGDFTPRVVPFKAGALVPLEADQILWQR
jgi:starch phosphorylase